MRKPMIGTVLTLILAAGCDRQEPASAPVNDVAATNDASAEQPSDPQIVEGLAGRTARVVLADGRTIMVTHERDGTARMTGEDGLEMTGRWSVTNGQLCFDWTGQPRECWPYGGPLTPGQTVRSSSDRGQVITTTLLPAPDDNAAETNAAAPVPAAPTAQAPAT